VGVGLSGQLHTKVTLPTGKKPLIPNDLEAQWAPVLVWMNAHTHHWQPLTEVLTHSLPAI
jgi:hypothetical protein